MDRDRFVELVDKAVADLPEEFLSKLDNVDVGVEDRPTYSQLRRAGLRRGRTLLGLYEGVPQTRRGRYNLAMPDKITIFKESIEARCHSDAEIKDEVGRVVRHEIAHHFGISDARLRELQQGKD